jgi:hypothetical protein
VSRHGRGARKHPAASIKCDLSMLICQGGLNLSDWRFMGLRAKLRCFEMFNENLRFVAGLPCQARTLCATRAA